jgi:ABC-type lipoprotein release transport system permease subunit
MLSLLLGILGTLAGVLLGYRLGCQRVIQRIEVVPDTPDLPAPISPHRAAEEWHRQNTRRVVDDT